MIKDGDPAVNFANENYVQEEELTDKYIKASEKKKKRKNGSKQVTSCIRVNLFLLGSSLRDRLR